MDMETEIQTLARSMTGADQEEQEYLAALCAAQWERIGACLKKGGDCAKATK